jgi:hypothetical protein
MASSSPPSSQSSLYQYYSPINSSESSSPISSRILRPSNRQNRVKSDVQNHTERPNKKTRLDVAAGGVCVSVRRRTERETITRSLLARELTGGRRVLEDVTCLYPARRYYSRPIDVHQVQTQTGQPTFPFAVESCNSTRTPAENTDVANSLVGVSDEVGDVRLLDTDIACPTGFTTECLRMHCHDNAIFDISWSYDDLKLVPPPQKRQLTSRPQRQETKLVGYSIS